MSKNISNINKSLNNQFATKEEVNAKANQTSVDSLQTNVGSLQTNVGSLQTNVSNLQTNVSSLQINVSNLQTNVNNKVNQSDYNSKISALESRVEEAFQNANNGKNLIATAIGAPLSGNDTFSAMSDKINGLTNDFKDALTNGGVEIADTDKLQDLIAKIGDMSGAAAGQIAGQIDLSLYAMKLLTMEITETAIGDEPVIETVTETVMCLVIPVNFEPNTISAMIEFIGSEEDGAASISQTYSYDSSVDYKLTCVTKLGIDGFTILTLTVRCDLLREGGYIYLPFVLGGEIIDENGNVIDTFANGATTNFYMVTGVGASAGGGTGTGNVGGRLNVISATSLPATGQEGQICVITNDSSNGYVLSSNPAPTINDRIILFLSESSTPNYYNPLGEVIYELNINKVFYNNKTLPSYYYSNNQWNTLTVPSVTYFDHGAFSFEGGTILTGNSYFSLSSNSINISLSSSYFRRASFDKAIDFTNYTTLEIKGYASSTSRTLYAYPYPSTVNNSSSSALYSSVTGYVSKAMPTSASTFTLDISSWTGVGYLTFESNKTTGTIYIMYVKIS